MKGLNSVEPMNMVEVFEHDIDKATVGGHIKLRVFYCAATKQYYNAAFLRNGTVSFIAKGEHKGEAIAQLMNLHDLMDEAPPLFQCLPGGKR